MGNEVLGNTRSCSGGSQGLRGLRCRLGGTDPIFHASKFCLRINFSNFGIPYFLIHGFFYFEGLTPMFHLQVG